MTMIITLGKVKTVIFIIKKGKVIIILVNRNVNHQVHLEMKILKIIILEVIIIMMKIVMEMLMTIIKKRKMIINIFLKKKKKRIIVKKYNQKKC